MVTTGAKHGHKICLHHTKNRNSIVKHTQDAVVVGILFNRSVSRSVVSTVGLVDTPVT